MTSSTTWRYFGLGCYVVIVAISIRLGISFATHALNVAALLAALIALSVLVLRLFHLKPKVLGLLIGSLGAMLWGVIALGVAGILILDSNSAVKVALDDGLSCQETVYGFATGDSGEELEVYQRFLIIDYRLYHQTHSEVYPNTGVVLPPHLAATVTRCQARINKLRSTPA